MLYANISQKEKLSYYIFYLHGVFFCFKKKPQMDKNYPKKPDIAILLTLEIVKLLCNLANAVLKKSLIFFACNIRGFSFIT